MTEAATRPANCKAVPFEDLMVCERCGLQWPAGTAAPSCDPITFERLHARMLLEVGSAEASLAMVGNLGSAGMPADPAPARRRLAEIGAVLRLVEGVMGNKAIKDLLNGKT